MRLFHIILFGLVLVALSGPEDKFPPKPGTGYWAMKGRHFTHPLNDDKDTLSENLIYELRDTRGLPVWFCRYFCKDVCITSQCKLVRLWLFWDGTGHYLGFQLPDNEQLTKSDHTVFSPADYVKLDKILQDSSSILKNYHYVDLLQDSARRTSSEVDGITAATQPALAELVVKNAVYTCFTLWHSVYGNTGDSIQNILHRRADPEFLNLLFDKGTPADKSWAISFIGKHTGFYHTFYSNIIDQIRTDQDFLAEQAIEYFKPERLTDFAVQRSLISVFPEISQEKKYSIIWKLSAVEKVDLEVVALLLDEFDRERISAGSVNLIFRMVQPEYLADKRIMTVLNHLAISNNMYIRNLTLRLLNKFNSN